MKRHHVLVFALTAVFALSLCPSANAERGPSTPEERARFVRISRSIEQDPLNETLRSEREWALRWLIEIPDISVTVCSGPLTKLLDTKKNYSAELFGHSLFASATFIIENPDQGNDPNVVYAAGVEGVLRMYERILAQKPKARHRILDELLQKRDRGELANHIRELSPCKSEK